MSLWQDSHPFLPLSTVQCLGAVPLAQHGFSLLWFHSPCPVLLLWYPGGSSQREAAFREGWPLLAVCVWAVSEHRGALCSCALHFGRRNPMRFGPLVSRMQNVQRPSVSLPRAWLPLQM